MTDRRPSLDARATMQELRRALVPALVVLVAAAAVLLAWVAARPDPVATRPLSAKDGAYTVGTIPGHGQHAVEEAVTAIPLALSYNYATLSEGLDEAVDHMTDSFAQEFRATFDKTARRLATSRKAVARATVRAAGLVSIDDDKAVVMMYVDQVLLSGKKPGGEDGPVSVSQNRVEVVLRGSGDSWEVDSIEPF